MKYFLPKIRKETKILDCTTYFKHLLEVLSSAITHTHTHTHTHTQHTDLKVRYRTVFLLLLFSFLHNYLCRKSNGIFKKKKSKTVKQIETVKMLKKKVKQKILKLLCEFSKFAVSNRQKSNLSLYTTKEQWEAETLKNQLN